jgi:hypothetical protein
MNTTPTTAKGTTMTARKPKGAPEKPLVTDEEYLDLLAIRLGAMHGFEADPVRVTAEQKNRARADVRNARKTRKVPAQIALNAAWNAYQEQLAKESEAKKSARPKRTRTPKEKVTEVPAPEVTPEVTETEQVAELVS